MSNNGNGHTKEAIEASVISPKQLNTIVGPFYAGIFLDNDVKHRNDVSSACFGKITAPIVPEGKMVIVTDETGREVKQPPTVLLRSDEYKAFKKKLSLETQETAATIFEQLRNISKGYTKGKETYDVVSGINKDIITEIQEWVSKKEHNGKKLVAIFDFDRTLTVMEGGFFYENSIEDLRDSLAKRLKDYPELWQDSTSPVNRLTVKTFAEYLAGGTERMEMLQGMFDFLHDKKVSIALLTNNTACPTKRNLFNEITKVYTNGQPVEILCGADFGYKKGETILATESLKEMCSNPKTTAGGRRRKTKRAHKKHKQKHRKTRRR